MRKCIKWLETLVPFLSFNTQLIGITNDRLDAMPPSPLPSTAHPHFRAPCPGDNTTFQVSRIWLRVIRAEISRDTRAKLHYHIFFLLRIINKSGYKNPSEHIPCDLKRLIHIKTWWKKCTYKQRKTTLLGCYSAKINIFRFCFYFAHSQIRRLCVCVCVLCVYIVLDKHTQERKTRADREKSIGKNCGKR